jgi:hypothetical protein
LRSIIIIPGIGNSDSRHWQTHWERSLKPTLRFCPSNWDSPDLADWKSALVAAVNRTGDGPTLVAHSLGCLLVVHTAFELNGLVSGALLVATPDSEDDMFPSEASTFKDPPLVYLPFKTLMISSSTDPYCTPERARFLGESWGSDLVLVGDRGHINSASDLGSWEEGKRYLNQLRSQLGRSASTEPRSALPLSTVCGVRDVKQ